LYIENQGTRQVVYMHVHYGGHVEMYIGIDSRFCLIICSQIKKIRILVAKPELLISCHPNERQSAQISWSAQRHDREWLSALMKNRGVRGRWNIGVVWTVPLNQFIAVNIHSYICLTLFFSLLSTLHVYYWIKTCFKGLTRCYIGGRNVL